MTSEEFRKARLELGLTQAQLAAKMGVNQSNISDIERGKHSPTRFQAKFIKTLRRWQAGEPFAVGQEA